MALSANVKRNYDLGVALQEATYNVIASDILYEGAAVSMAGGADDVGPQAASDPFVGFVQRKVDNAAGAAGDKQVRVATKGRIIDLAVTGATINSAPGTAVYASDDGTFTTTSSSAFEQIGKINKGKGTGSADVDFEGIGARSV